MEQFIGYLKEYEVWIYAALVLVGLPAIVKFGQAWEELRASAFGIERDIAQNKLNQAGSLIVLVLLLAVAEFTLVSYIGPSLPQARPLPSPTLNLIATPTTTLPASQAALTPLPATPVPTAGIDPATGCLPGQVMITEPSNGETVTGIVVIRGTADIANFGFYKYEVARPGDTVWLPINAGEKPVQDDILGEWITTVLPPGDYLLRLVVADNQGKFMPACTVRLRVVAPTPQS